MSLSMTSWPHVPEVVAKRQPRLPWPHVPPPAGANDGRHPEMVAERHPPVSVGNPHLVRGEHALDKQTRRILVPV